jgi:hypothetical protein
MDEPTHCPEGHELGPGRASLTYAGPELDAHRLYCTACQQKTRILLVDGAEWEVNIGGRWVILEN